MVVEKSQAVTKRQYHIQHSELPVCCPPVNSEVWDAHPRVYLSIEETGRVVCPYCDAEFILADADLNHE